MIKLQLKGLRRSQLLVDQVKRLANVCLSQKRERIKKDPLRITVSRDSNDKSGFGPYRVEVSLILTETEKCVLESKNKNFFRAVDSLEKKVKAVLDQRKKIDCQNKSHRRRQHV